MRFDKLQCLVQCALCDTYRDPNSPSLQQSKLIVDLYVGFFVERYFHHPSENAIVNLFYGYMIRVNKGCFWLRPSQIVNEGRSKIVRDVCTYYTYIAASTLTHSSTLSGAAAVVRQ